MAAAALSALTGTPVRATSGRLDGVDRIWVRCSPPTTADTTGLRLAIPEIPARGALCHADDAPPVDGMGACRRRR